MLRLTLVSTLQQHGCVVCLAPTCHMTKVRPSINSPHQGLVLHLTPEYQCPWFQFYKASNFYCMMITAEPTLPSIPPSETRVTATATVASATVAVANDNDHPRDGHNVDNHTSLGREDSTIPISRAYMRGPWYLPNFGPVH